VPQRFKGLREIELNNGHFEINLNPLLQALATLNQPMTEKNQTHNQKII
jgi:hypothetical protein